MFMNCEQKYHFPIGRRQKNNHCCPWIVNKTENSDKSALKMYINCRNVNESNTIQSILSCLCSLFENKKCGLYFVWCAKIYFVSWKILVMWKSILFRKKIFRSSSSKKHFVSQAKNIYMVLVPWTGKNRRGKNWYSTKP